MLHSLRARLALWLLLPLAVLVAVCGWFAHEHAEDAADYVQDHDLLSSAKILADRLIWEDGDVRASVPPSALSLFMSPAHDQVYLSVRNVQGQLLAGQPDFPLPDHLQLQGSDNAQWYDTEWRGQPLRAVITSRAMYELAGAREVRVIVAKTTHSRDDMVRTLWWPTMQYLLWALAIAVLVSATALTLELRPLLVMARQLATRPAQDMDFHLDSRALHHELRPLTDTVNQFAHTLRAQVARQRQFISDAAHQLRTPLAVQAHTLEQALPPPGSTAPPATEAERTALLQRLQRSNQQLLAVTNQLLLLAQAEQAGSAQATQRVDLRALCLQCLEAFAPLAEQKNTDLGWQEHAAAQSPAQPYMLHTTSHLLPELVSNLLDNALRYTPANGQVTLSLHALPDALLLAVEDNGPGIPAQSRDQVLERFFRLATHTPGTGLGLSIVREIARSCQAHVTLSDAHQGALPGRPGLRVEVRFVRQPGAA